MLRELSLSALCTAFLLLMTARANGQPQLFFGFRGGPAMPELRLGPREVPVIPGPSSGRSLGLFMRYGRKTYCDLDVNWSHASHSLEIYPGGAVHGRRSCPSTSSAWRREWGIS